MELVSLFLLSVSELCVSNSEIFRIYIGRFINSHHAWTDNLKHSSLLLPTYNWCWFHNDLTIRMGYLLESSSIDIHTIINAFNLLFHLYCRLSLFMLIHSFVQYQVSLQLQNPPDSVITRKNKTTKSVKTVTA